MDKSFETISKEVRDFSGQLYRYTYHRGAELISIEVMECVGFWRKKWRWRRLYFGFPSRLKEATDFFDEQKKIANEKQALQSTKQ